MPLETIASLKVDLLDPGAPQVIHAVQDDSNSRSVAFSLYAGGAQWVVPDGTLVTVRYKKPDGTAGFYDTLPDGSTPAATIDGNVVTVALVPQAFTVCGNVPVQIKLYNSAGASIATFAIVMHVSANVVSDAEIVSSDYYSVLTKQIAEVLAAAEGIPGQVSAAQEAAEQAASSASAAEGSATAAAGSASAASTAARQAQTAATNAGASETNAASSASDAEDAKTAAETAAGNARDDAAAAESAKTAAQTAATNAENAAERAEALVYSGAGAHNSVYRGKDLGASVTAEQYAAIAAGTFDDLYIGDYWTIGGVTYRIAAFDYYLQTGDVACTDHHVTLIPDASLYTGKMNDEGITTGAYANSKMRTSELDQAKAKINAGFGQLHVLTHRSFFQNAVTDSYASGGSWYDSAVDLMTEQTVYGGRVFGNSQSGTAKAVSNTIDKSQYPLFAFRPDLLIVGTAYFLRDVASDTEFCSISAAGNAAYSTANGELGVRPAFSIIG